MRTVSAKIKFLFSARGIRLVFWDEQAAVDRAISSTFATANPSRGGRGAHSTQLGAGSALPRNQIVSIRGNKEVDRAVPYAMLNISGIAASNLWLLLCPLLARVYVYWTGSRRNAIGYNLQRAHT